MTRLSACVVIRALNKIYIADPEVVNMLHAHTFVALGIKQKIYEGEYLMAIVDLLNEIGVSNTLGECIEKATSHFLHSINFNLTGQNTTTNT